MMIRIWRIPENLQPFVSYTMPKAVTFSLNINGVSGSPSFFCFPNDPIHAAGENHLKPITIYSVPRTDRAGLFGLPLLHFLAGALLLGAAGPNTIAEEVNRPSEVFGGAPTDRWVYGAEVYLWGANLGGETVTGDDIDVSFTDLVKDLDIGFMTTLAAAKGKWTAFADLIYLDVSDDIKSTANIIGQPVRLELDAEVKGFVTTLGGAYSFFESDCTRLNAILGARYEWLELDLEFDVGPFKEKVSDSGRTWDAIVGFRGKSDFSDKWYLDYYADIGTGDSDLTWQALASINYRFRKIDAVFGYRYIEWDFDDTNLLDNLNLHGPFAGIKFLF